MAGGDELTLVSNELYVWAAQVTACTAASTKGFIRPESRRADEARDKF